MSLHTMQCDISWHSKIPRTRYQDPFVLLVLVTFSHVRLIAHRVNCLCLFLLCLGLRHYMVRYREKNRKWNYQTCPTSDTVIDKLKPNTVYEFGVQPNSKDGSGVWSKPVVHNISMASVEGMFDLSVMPKYYLLWLLWMENSADWQGARQGNRVTLRSHY